MVDMADTLTFLEAARESCREHWFRSCDPDATDWAPCPDCVKYAQRQIEAQKPEKFLTGLVVPLPVTYHG